MTEAGDPQDERPTFVCLLAGGRGTRFWPASRTAQPKQFLRILGDRSLLRLTYERFARLARAERILIVTGPQYAERTRAEVPELPAGNLVVEPSGRDTAPAAALAAAAACERESDPILVLAPPDHFIGDEPAFARSLESALAAARDDALVVFGVVPDRPATQFGYIEVAAPPEAERAAPVVRFREKPALEEAETFVASGRFLWNAGIFVWRARVFQERLARANPAFAEACHRLPPAAAPGAPGFDRFSEGWERLPAISIDYALMEKAEGIRVVPLAAGWSDVGGWDAAREFLPADAAGNRAAEDVLYLRARGCSVHRLGTGTARRFYALVGAEDLIVVETDDAVMICRKGAGESMREVIQRLQADGRAELL